MIAILDEFAAQTLNPERRKRTLALDSAGSTPCRRASLTRR